LSQGAWPGNWRMDGEEDIIVLDAGEVQDDSWSCPSCTFLNKSLSSGRCLVCSFALPFSGGAPSAAAAAGVSSVAAAAPQANFSVEGEPPLEGIGGALWLARQAPGVQDSLLYRHLCCDSVAFFSQTVMGSGWACGWRCIQMVLSPLLRHPATRARLFDGSGRPPSIACLQAALEAAWARGYDRTGSEQLGGRVAGTRKFIGAGEATALLRSLGVPAQWASFHSFDDPNLEALASAAQLARARKAREAAESVRGRKDPSQLTLLQAGFTAPQEAAPQSRQPTFFSCRSHNFDACRGCFEHVGGGSGGGESRGGRASSSGAGEGRGLRCKMGCALTPCAAPLQSHLVRICDLCRREEQGPREAERADTPFERFYLHARHAALVRWLRTHFQAGPPAGGGTGTGSGGSNGGGGGAHPPPSPRPLCCYLQHDGHSRVLAGYEVTTGAGGALSGIGSAGALAADPPPNQRVSLYILDPGVAVRELQQGLQGEGWAPLVKRGLHTLRKAHYEVCWVPHPSDWDKFSGACKELCPTPTRFFE
jgi:hypothetical protein